MHEIFATEYQLIIAVYLNLLGGEVITVRFHLQEEI